MSAYVIQPSKKDWKVISAFLSEVREGAIVVPPEHQAKLKEACGGAVASYVSDYDGFSDPDYVIDIAKPDCAATYAWDALVEESKVADV